MKSIQDLSVFKSIRKNILKMALHYGSNAHIGGALSIADLMGVLFQKN